MSDETSGARGAELRRNGEGEAQDPCCRAEPPWVAEEDLAPLPPLAAIEALLENGDERPVGAEERHRLPDEHA